MPSYVVLIKFTEQGAKNIEGSVQRARDFRARGEQQGVRNTGLWWTQGRYDAVAAFEAPDDQTMSAALLSLAKAGNVRTETLRAYDESEMEAVIRKIQ